MPVPPSRSPLPPRPLGRLGIATRDLRFRLVLDLVVAAVEVGGAAGVGAADGPPRAPAGVGVAEVPGDVPARGEDAGVAAFVLAVPFDVPAPALPGQAGHLRPADVQLGDEGPAAGLERCGTDPVGVHRITVSATPPRIGTTTTAASSRTWRASARRRARRACCCPGMVWSGRPVTGPGRRTKPGPAGCAGGIVGLALAVISSVSRVSFGPPSLDIACSFGPGGRPTVAAQNVLLVNLGGLGQPAGKAAAQLGIPGERVWDVLGVAGSAVDAELLA